MIGIARNSQAVLIDMALTLPSFILSTLEFSGNLEVPLLVMEPVCKALVEPAFGHRCFGGWFFLTIDWDMNDSKKCRFFAFSISQKFQAFHWQMLWHMDCHGCDMMRSIQMLEFQVASVLGGLTFALTFGISVQLAPIDGCGGYHLNWKNHQGSNFHQMSQELLVYLRPSRFALIFFFKSSWCLRYAVLCNLDGKDPDGVPLISNVTKNVVDRGTFFDPPKEDEKWAEPRHLLPLTCGSQEFSDVLCKVCVSKTLQKIRECRRVRRCMHLHIHLHIYILYRCLYSNFYMYT